MAMRKITVFGEIYSENVGDGIIFDNIKHSLVKSSNGMVQVKGIDLSLREEYRKKKQTLVKRKIIPRTEGIIKCYNMLNWWRRDRKKYEIKWEKEITQSDVVVIGGGQIFTDINMYFPLRIYLVYKLCKKFNKPLVIFSVGGNQKWGFIAKYFYKKVALYSSLLSVRDKITFNNFYTMKKVNQKVELILDPGFISNETYSDIIKSNVEKKESLAIGWQAKKTLSLFSTKLKKMTTDEYFLLWITIVESLTSMGFDIEVFNNGDNNDHIEMLEFVSFCGDKGIKIPHNEKPDTPEELIKIINNYRTILATRLHACIISESMGKVVFPIVWDKKVAGVWKFIKKEELLSHLDSLTANGLSNTVGLNTEYTNTLSDEKENFNNFTFKVLSLIK